MRSGFRLVLLKQGLSLALCLAMLGQAVAWPMPERDALAPWSAFQPADEADQEPVVYDSSEENWVSSEILDAWSRPLPNNDVVIWDAALRNIPPELFSSPRGKRKVHFIGPTRDAIEDAIRKRGLVSYPFPDNFIAHEADISMVPQALREGIARAIADADGSDVQDAMRKLREAYAAYKPRPLPEKLEEAKAGLVISTTGMEDISPFFIESIVPFLAKKYRLSPREIERLAAKDWEDMASRLMSDHAARLYRACDAQGMVYFCSPIASLSPRRAPGIGLESAIRAYRGLARAWQRGILHASNVPPVFVTRWWENRQAGDTPMAWLSPQRIVLNAEGSAFLDYFSPVATNVFGRDADRDTGAVFLSQSMLLKPVLGTTPSTAKEVQAAETALLPPWHEPSLQESLAYALPLLKTLPTVASRLDLLIKTLKAEQQPEEKPLIDGLSDLRTSRYDMEGVEERLRGLMDRKVLTREQAVDFAMGLLLDEETPSAREAIASRISLLDASPGGRDQGPSPEEILASDTVQALSALALETAAQAVSDKQWEALLKERLVRADDSMPWAKAVDASSVFVLDHGLYLKLKVGEKWSALRFYHEGRKPFNVLRDLSSAEWIAWLMHPSQPGLRVQTERRGQVKDALTWDYADVAETAELARELEQGGETDAVEALKALRKRLSRQEFHALMNRLGLTALQRQLPQSKDPEALKILREYLALAEKIHDLESALEGQWEDSRALADALLNKNADDAQYLDIVVCMAQRQQDHLSQQPHRPMQHVRDALRMMLLHMPMEHPSEYPGMPVEISLKILDEIPPGTVPEDWRRAKQLLKALDLAIEQAREEWAEWKKGSLWRTLFWDIEDVLEEGKGMERRLQERVARRDDLSAKLAQRIEQKAAPEKAGVIAVYFSKLPSAKAYYVLDKIDDIAPEGVKTFLALTALPLENLQDAKFLDFAQQALENLRMHGVNVFADAPFFKQKNKVLELFARVQERLAGLPYYDNGAFHGFVPDKIQEETAVFWKREMVFQWLLEAIEAQYGNDLLLMVESGETAGREDTVLDRNARRCSGHAMQLVFKNTADMREAQVLLPNLKRSLEAAGVSLELYDPATYAAGALSGGTEHMTRAALLKGSAIDQCIASMENRVEYAAGKEAEELMDRRSSEVVAPAIVPREAVGYAMLQQLLMQERGLFGMPQKLAHHALRTAFAKMLLNSRGAVLQDMRRLMGGNRPRGFSHAVDAVARKHLNEDPEELQLMHEAYRNEGGSFFPQSPALQDFIDKASAYVARTVAELAQDPRWVKEEDKDALRAAPVLWPLFKDEVPQWLGNGRVLLRAGEQAKSVYFVLSGAADVVARDAEGRSLLRRTYRAGSMLGEKLVLPDSASDADIVASSDLLLMAANKTRFWRALDENPALKATVLDLLFRTQLANLEKAQEAAAGGADASGIMLRDLLQQEQELKSVFTRAGISPQRIGEYQKGLKLAALAVRDLQDKELHAAVEAKRRTTPATPSFAEMLEPLIEELQGMASVRQRAERVLRKLRESGISEAHSVMRALKDLTLVQSLQERLSILEPLKRTKVISPALSVLLAEEPALAPGQKRAWVTAGADPIAWDARFRQSLKEQGAPMPRGKDVYLMDKEGQIRPMTEVDVEEMIRPNALAWFLDISPDARIARHYAIPPDTTVEEFLRRVDDAAVKPDLETPAVQAYGLIGAQYRNGLLRFGPGLHRSLLISWDSDGDRGFRLGVADSIRLHQALADAGVFQGNIACAAVIFTGDGRCAAALAQIPGLKDLYYTDVSPYALSDTTLHVSKNLREGKAPREHAVLGAGFRGLRGKFDLIVADPESILFSDPKAVEQTALYRGTGMLQEILECAPDKLNEKNPEAQLFLISSPDQRDKLSKFLSQYARRYFIEPFDLGGNRQIYRLRLKSFGLEPEEMQDERAMLRERLRNLDAQRGRAITDEALTQALQEAFGMRFDESKEYADFLRDFSGLNNTTYQIWHSFLPAELSLAENIRLMAGILSAVKKGKEALGEKVISIDLRALIEQLKDTSYLQALRAQWKETRPEEGLKLSKSVNDPYAYVVSTALLPKSEAVPVEAELPPEPIVAPALAAPRRAFAGAPQADGAERFFQLMALPEEALERTVRYKFQPGYALQVMDKKWVEDRAAILSEWGEVRAFLLEMMEKYRNAGLELKMALLEEKEPFFRTPMSSGGDLESRTLIQRVADKQYPDKESVAIVIPAAVFRLASEGGFAEVLRPVLEHHLKRKTIADALEKHASGMRVSPDQRKTWAAQFALYAAMLQERQDDTLPPRIAEALSSAPSEDLQRYVKDTDKDVKLLGENKLFELHDAGQLLLTLPVPGGIGVMVKNHRKLIAEHAMDILAQRGLLFSPSYVKNVGELKAMAEEAQKGMVQAVEQNGIPFVFLAQLIATARNHYQTSDALAREVQHNVLNEIHYACGTYRQDPALRAAILNILQLCDEWDGGARSQRFVELLGTIKAQRDVLGYKWRRPDVSPLPKNPLPGTDALDIGSGLDFAEALGNLRLNEPYAVVDRSRFVGAYLKEHRALTGNSLVSVWERDVMALPKPREALGLVRARNAWAYVPRLNDKLWEMADWLEPGGHIVLECDANDDSRKAMQSYTAGIVEALVAEGWKAEQFSGMLGDRVTLVKPGKAAAASGGLSRREFMIAAAALVGGRAATKLLAEEPAGPKLPQNSTLDEAKRIVVRTFEAYHHGLNATIDVDSKTAQAVFAGATQDMRKQILQLLKDEPEFKGIDRLSPDLDTRLLYDWLPRYFLRNGLYFAAQMKMVPLSGKLIELPTVCLYEIEGDMRDIQEDLRVFTAKAKEVMLRKALLPWFVSKESPDERALSGTIGSVIYHDLEMVKDEARRLWAYRAAYKNDLELFENTALMNFLKGKGMRDAMRLLKNAFVYMAYEKALSGNDEEAFVRRYVEKNLAMHRVHELTHVYDMKEFKQLVQKHPESVREIMEERAFLMPIALGENAYHALRRILDMAEQKGGIHTKAASVILSSLHEFITNPPPEFKDPRFLATEDGKFFRQLQQPPPGISAEDARLFLIIQTARMTPVLWSNFARLMFNATQDTLGQWEKGAPVPPLVPVGQTIKIKSASGDDSQTASKLSDALRIARIEANLSITELGKILGVNYTTVTRWEEGVRVPELAKIPDIAIALGKDANDLLAVYPLPPGMSLSVSATRKESEPFGKRLITLRTNAGLTQEDLGRYLGVSGVAVLYWEKGESIPDLAMIPRIAEILKVSVEDLLETVPLPPRMSLVFDLEEFRIVQRSI